ncbi:MAG: sulfite exporter TauE/SafE family protein [Proteobacteria bacterium]|nr:sulfite exporter TauE/SafE family protein [Pseudomonadota bacterium]MBU4468871.1 sulfite exporter TauE/SafE family protein [Pseudomonadota bacterium]MCG2750864.1 sulfite exporter TauE/SafE family protein [Desulfobacteraceae bacterium]
MYLDGFFLGLSNSVTCAATCTPVLIPYLLGEGKGIVPNFGVTGRFLFGRLLGYLLFAVLAWTLSSAILQNASHRNLAIGMAYILFSGLLIFYGLIQDMKAPCKTVCNGSRVQGFLDRWPEVLPVSAGFATGSSFCPPFMLAITGATSKNSLTDAMFFFFSFFLGTSLLFVLAPFAGMFRRFQILRMVGKLASGLMGFYYLYSESRRL